MSSVVESDRRLVRPDPPPRPRWSRRTGRVVVLLAAAVFLAALALVIDDQVEHDRSFDRSQHALQVTRHRTSLRTAQLAQLRHDLALLTAQVGDDNTALQQDTDQLKAAQSGLAQSQSTVTRQGTQITSLQTCLNGVEEALNALATGDQNGAVAAIESVSSACTAATAASG